MVKERMVVEEAKLENIPVIVNLWKELASYHENLMIEKNRASLHYVALKENASEFFKKEIKKHIESKNSIIYMVKVGELPVGYCLVYIKRNRPTFKLKKKDI